MKLIVEIEKVIKKGVSIFYVNNYGAFDKVSVCALKELKEKYPHIQIVLVPLENDDAADDIFEYDRVYWLKLHKSMRLDKFFRNNFLLNNSDVLFVYLKTPYSSTQQFVNKAREMNIPVINVGE